MGDFIEGGEKAEKRRQRRDKRLAQATGLNPDAVAVSSG